MSADSNSGLLIMRPGVHPRQVVGKKIPPPPEFSDRREDGLRIERNVAVPLRDGVRILIDIYTPELASQPLPILLGWSPYGKHNVSDRLPWPAADVASRPSTKQSALTWSTVGSASPWKMMSGTLPAPRRFGGGPCFMAWNADTTSLAAPYANPECTPAAAYSSG